MRRHGGRSARAPQRAVAGWPRLPRPATPQRESKTAKPGERAAGTVFGSPRLGAKRSFAAIGRVRCAPQTRAKGRAGRRAHGMGWECNGGSRATFGVRTETCGPRCRAWQRSIRLRAGSTGPWCARDGGRMHNVTTTVVEPARSLARHCVVVDCITAAVGLCRTTTSAGVRRGGAPRWPRQSRAPTGAKRELTNRVVGDLALAGLSSRARECSAHLRWGPLTGTCSSFWQQPAETTTKSLLPATRPPAFSTW